MTVSQTLIRLLSVSVKDSFGTDKTPVSKSSVQQIETKVLTVVNSAWNSELKRIHGIPNQGFTQTRALPKPGLYPNQGFTRVSKLSLATYTKLYNLAEY